MSKKEIGNSVCLLNFLQYISKILVGLFGFQSSQESILSYFLVVALITETLLEPEFVTYKYPLFESKDIPLGSIPTDIVFTIVFVEPLITETLLETEFVTYKYPLFESKDIPLGSIPTDIVFTIVFVEPLITETLLEPEFVTYKYPLFESKDIPFIFDLFSLILRFMKKFEPLITDTLSERLFVTNISLFFESNEKSCEPLPINTEYIVLEDEALIADTLLVPEFAIYMAIYMYPLIGSKNDASGYDPISILPSTLKFDPLIIDIVLCSLFIT